MLRMGRLLPITLLAAGALFAVPGFADAASGETITGSGAVQEEEPLTPTADERIRVIANLNGNTQPTRTLLTKALDAREALNTERRDAALRLRVHLQECSEELRRANRDQKFPTTLRCHRGRLMLELTWLRKQRQAIYDDKSVPLGMGTEALEDTDALIDAIAAIVGGIDSGVYKDESGLREGKTLLQNQYRLRQWTAVLRMDAERLKAWLVLLAKDALEHIPALKPGEASAWDASAGCLEETAGWLTQAKQATTYEDALAAWASARSQAATCMDIVEKARKSRPKTSGSGSNL